jgi:hypothetical protein
MLGERMLNRFGDRIDELESIVREIAIDITTGTFVEKLPPEKVWEKTGDRIEMVSGLIRELREYLFMLKPEKVPSIQQQVADIYERLGAFQERLKLDVEAPGGGTRLSIDELRQALVEISEFVSFCRAVKVEPSDIINSILRLREAQITEEFSIAESKIKRLRNLVKEAQSSQREATEASKRLENQLEAIRSEYEDLIVSLYRKEEE